MPDSQGRYSLSDMQNLVVRLLNANAITVNTTTGAETSSIIQNQSFSNTDITNQINTALVGTYTEVALSQPEQFSQTTYQSYTMNNVGPYAFPFGMLQLRYMDWLPYGVLFQNARPENWIEMLPYGDPMDRSSANTFGAPTWEWDNSGTAFVLNSWPTQSNPNGIRIRAVVLPQALVNLTDVIQARFVLVMQEVVVYDAAYALAWSKLKQVTDEIQQGRDDWHKRLSATADNAFHPPSVQMTTDRLIAGNYSGRRRRGGYGGWG